MTEKNVKTEIPVLTFDSAQEMLDCIRDGTDLYSPEEERYVFLYNDAGAIADYCISLEEAQELEKDSRKYGEECWSALLGPGGDIWDDPQDENNPPNEGCSNLDFCEKFFQHCWIEANSILDFCNEIK